MNRDQFEDCNTKMEPTPQKKSGLATAGLVLGIIGVVISFTPFISCAFLILGFLAIIFGGVALANSASKGTSIAALVLGILTVVITISMQFFWLQVLVGLDNDPSGSQAVDDLENDLGYFLGEKTDDILKNYLDVEIGSFTIDSSGYWDDTELLVTLKNKGSERCSFDVTIEAIDQNGNRIATDTAYVSDLGAGQSQIVKLFRYVSSDEIEALRTATVTPK